MTLPKRTPDTMSDAIAQSSPNGSMSGRARKAAQERLRQALFGDGLRQAPVQQPSAREALLRQAADLRQLAAHGVKPRAHIRKAEELEAKARTG